MMENTRYVTYTEDGALDGCYLQEPPEEHVDRMIEIDEAQAAAWVNMRANAARDGLEPAPAVAPTPVIPDQVTMRQARLALLGSGLLDRVSPAIEALPSPHKEVARIEWDYSSAVVRSRPLVGMLGQQLNLTEQQLDQLFITAAGL
jgi:hypothetical protein